MRKIWLLFLLLPTQIFSQTTDPDSVFARYERERGKNPEKALQHILNGIKKAEQRDDKYHVAAYLVKLIEQKNFIRDYNGAYLDFRKAEKYCLDHKIEGQLPCAYSQYAETCFNKEDLTNAMKYFHLADSIFAKQKDGIGVMISKSNIANIYQVQGKYDLAIKNLLYAAKHVDTSQYRYIKVSIFKNISELYSTIGDRKKAEEMVRTAMTIALGGNISRDLHDNIGAQLTFIISSVDNVKFGFNLQNTKLNDKLDSISDFTKSTILELRDTIWAMNHSEISFEELRSRIFNFLEKAKTAKESIDYSFNLDESIKELKLSSLQGINIYRTIQEAVNNAIKYSEATKIVIEAKSENNRTTIEIRDNSVGFDTGISDRGNGLGNMKKRMKEIGANWF